MAAKPAAAKKGAATPVVPNSVSLMEAGKGSTRVKTRLIVLYGGPKVQKTGSCSTIKGAKWIVSDPNTIPTLDALDRLPPDKDIYEVTSLKETRAVILKMLEVCEKNGPEALGCTAVIKDSATQLVDWHQQDVARETNQRFMGDVKNNNGWQQFNAEFSAFIDDLGLLSKYITVIVICHAKEKMDLSKGDWAGLNLPPQMALKMGRTANWVLYQSKRSYTAGEKDKPDEYVRLSEPDQNGVRKAVEVVIHTETNGLWLAAANGRNLKAEEPGDMAALLRKEGLLE